MNFKYYGRIRARKQTSGTGEPMLRYLSKEHNIHLSILSRSINTETFMKGKESREAQL